MSINETMVDDGIQQIKTSEHAQNEIVVETSKRHGELYVAAINGDWRKAEEIFKNNPGDVLAELSDVGDTVLHVAAAEGRNNFVKELVSKYMKENNLETRNKEGNTALSFAAMSGNTELAELMLKKNKKLAMIRYGNDRNGTLPVLVAAFLGHEKMVRYLYTATKDKDNFTDEDNFTDDDRIELLVTLIDNDLYGVALSMVEDFPELAVSRIKLDQKGNEKKDENGKKDNIGETALHALARKPLTYNDLDKSKQGILKRHYYQRNNMVKNKTMHPDALKLVALLWKNVVNQLDYRRILELVREPRRLIFDAAKEGNIDFLSILTSTYPDLMSKVNEDGYSIFHTAVSYRHENIFELIYKKPSIKNAIVATTVRDDDNNILHLAAMLPPDRNRLKIVSGAALQMQRELWWFKEVSKLMPPFYAEAQNRQGKTARTLFTESHKDLMKDGEKWMKTTANSCMLVATLIATIVFAAAFTVPGSVKGDTGTPNFIKKASFITFAIFDTISLVSSASSILTFLAILTARYAEEQFLWFLPTMLLFGLSTLLISIIGMMVVFCTTLFIVFDEGTKVPAILAVALACIPVIQFILQQILLILDVFGLISTTLFHKSQKQIKGGTSEGGA